MKNIKLSGREPPSRRQSMGRSVFVPNVAQVVRRRGADGSYAYEGRDSETVPDTQYNNIIVVGLCVSVSCCLRVRVRVRALFPPLVSPCHVVYFVFASAGGQM